MNLEQFSRYDIARQVNIINSFNPKVIGIDAIFQEEKEHHSDSILADAFSKCRNLVLVSQGWKNMTKKKEIFDTLLTSINFLTNMPQMVLQIFQMMSKVSFRTIREFRPISKVNGYNSHFICSKDC